MFLFIPCTKVRDVGRLAADFSELARTYVAKEYRQSELGKSGVGIGLEKNECILKTTVGNLIPPYRRPPNKLGALALIEQNISVLQSIRFKVFSVEVHRENI